MPVTKITLSTAMRARDVSRPHEEHLTEAAEREQAITRPAAPTLPKPTPPAGKPASEQPSLPLADTQPAAPPPARRRRRRRSLARGDPGLWSPADGNHKALTAITARRGERFLRVPLWG